jgi:hypothetical protein
VTDVYALQAALIRLLWNAHFDDESCDGDCEDDGSPYAVCDAMRALGWGQHFTAEAFEECVRLSEGAS